MGVQVYYKPCIVYVPDDDPCTNVKVGVDAAEIPPKTIGTATTMMRGRRGPCMRSALPRQRPDRNRGAAPVSFGSA